MLISDPHIVVHAEQGVFEVGTGEAVLRDFADAAILHVAAEQPGQHHTDSVVQILAMNHGCLMYI